MFIIYNLGILCKEYLQVHIHTHTHIVRVKLQVRVFMSRRLALCDFSVCFPDDPPSQLHRLQIIVFSRPFRCGRFAYAVENPFQSPGAPAGFIVLLFPLSEETDPQTCP